MGFEDEFPPDFRELIRQYSLITREQLKLIRPKWAFGADIDHMQDGSLHPLFGNYTIFLVDVNELISKVDFISLNPSHLFSGDEASDSRVAKIIDDWTNGRFIDPPTLSTHTDGTLSLSDGRHRSIVAYHIGVKTIPVAIHNTMIEYFSKKIGLRMS